MNIDENLYIENQGTAESGPLGLTTFGNDLCELASLSDTI
jgi:hypothetical protein